MRAIDLYCGMGGASLGLKNAGYSVTGYDSWKHAVDSHNTNGMPAAKIDINRNIDWTKIVEDLKIDTLWASPPCQPFSQANGNAKSVKDNRDGFPATIVAISQILPRLVIIENVKGLVSKKNLPFFLGYVYDIERLGYSINWSVLNSSDYGIPQSRKRCFIVARCDGAEPKFPEKQDEIITMAKALKDTIYHIGHIKDLQQQLLVLLNQKLLLPQHGVRQAMDHARTSQIRFRSLYKRHWFFRAFLVIIKSVDQKQHNGYKLATQCLPVWHNY